jgi:hypothetical protein
MIQIAIPFCCLMIYNRLNIQFFPVFQGGSVEKREIGSACYIPVVSHTMSFTFSLCRGTPADLYYGSTWLYPILTKYNRIASCPTYRKGTACRSTDLHRHSSTSSSRRENLCRQQKQQQVPPAILRMGSENSLI